METLYPLSIYRFKQILYSKHRIVVIEVKTYNVWPIVYFVYFMGAILKDSDHLE